MNTPRVMADKTTAAIDRYSANPLLLKLNPGQSRPSYGRDAASDTFFIRPGRVVMTG